MSESVLLLVNCPAGQETPDKSTLECLTAAREIKAILSGSLSVGLIGSAADAVAAGLGNPDIDHFFKVSDPVCDQPRYVSDVAAAQAIAIKSQATVVVAPATSRISRMASGLAGRLQGVVDTQISAVGSEDGLTITRWYYRQRMKASLSRSRRPWVLTVSSGCFAPSSVSPSDLEVERVDLNLDESVVKTETLGVKSGSSDSQTIRPEAEMLLVAGAGWTKKQADGQIHAAEAEKLILDFIEETQSSLGSSKSLVDLGTEGQAVLPFLTHLHQIGQTGSTPRHQKGLATCCHGEEPHAVGWRFINERRAINTDAGCSWAQGKADVLYVADAFAVMKRVNELLAE